MSPKGGDRGGRRPLKTEGIPRAPFSCRLKETNLEWVQIEKDRTGKSAGEIVDIAIETLKEHPGKQPPDKPEDTEE